MNLSTVMATYLIFIIAGVFSPSIFAKPNDITPDAFEFKVMLKNALFAANTRDTGINDFIAKITTQAGITMSEDRKEKARIVSYLDTKKCDLLKNNYILRKRFTLKDDVPDQLKITLKYRGSEADEVGKKSYQATPSTKLTKSKYEVDIVTNSASQTQRKLAYSASIKLGKIKKISQLQSLYPVLNELDIKGKRKLKKVNNFTAFEIVVKIGTLNIADQSCDASFSFWYATREKTTPIASEFSYVCDHYNDAGHQLYQYIMEKKDWVDSHLSTKTAMAYGDYCNH